MDKKNNFFTSSFRSDSFKEYLILFLFTFGCFLIFHRTQVFSCMDLLCGDAGDARLNILIADSWRDYFSGRLPLRQTRIFYPAPDTQGFTDLNLSLFLLSGPLRLLGLDEIRSVQIFYIFLLFFGVFSFYYLARKVLDFSFPLSLSGALFAGFNSAFFQNTQHTQFYFLMFLPLFAIFFARFLQNYVEEKRENKLILYGCGMIITYAVIAYSNFYTSFFLALFLFFFLLSFFFYRIFSGEGICFSWKKAGVLIILFLFFVVLFLPFLYIYLPVMKKEFLRDWDLVSGGLPIATDILNFGKDNLLWGKLYEKYFPPIHKNFIDYMFGLPVISFLLLCYAFFHFCKRLREKKNIYPPYLIPLFAALFLAFIFTVKVYPYRSLFWCIWKFFPGANGIRQGVRIYVFLMLPLALFVMCILREKAKSFSSGRALLFTGILGAALFADHLNLLSHCKWSIEEARKSMVHISSPPKDCKVFFLKPAPPMEDLFAKNVFQSQIALKAWNMANKFGIFTINGYSGNVPREEGGNLLGGIAEKGYADAVENWIRKWKISYCYMYDWEKDQYFPYYPGIAIAEEKRLWRERK